MAAPTAAPPPTPETRTTGGFITRSAVAAKTGIAKEQSTNLESVGHSMKSESVRIQEANAKYGGHSAYPHPPPPDISSMANDLESGQAQKVSMASEGSGKKKKIIIGILIFLILAGLVVGITFAAIALSKSSKPKPAPKK